MKLVYLSGALVLGVFAGSSLEPAALPFFIAAGSLALVAGLGRRHRYALYLVLVAVLLAGFGRGTSEAPGSTNETLSRYHEGSVVEVEGLIANYPEPRGALTQFRFHVTRLRAGEAWEDASGAVLVRAPPSPELAGLREPPYFRYGDTLRLTGRLEEPPVLDDFDWRDHLAREGIHSLMLRPRAMFIDSGGGVPLLTFIYRIREEMARGLAQALPEPQASLSQALVLGIRGPLSSELRDDLAKTGTTHLIAVSGIHMGILAGLVSVAAIALLGRRRHLYILIPLLFLWGYALLTGLAPPVVRAAIMGSLYLWAVYLGRQRSGMVALAAAAAIMVGIDPGILEEVSFRLSFLAMAGLILLAPWFQAGGRRLVALVWMPEGRGLGLALLFVDVVSISLAAILATLPVVAFNFHMVSLVGLPATIIILPVFPLILITSLMVAFFGAFAPAVAQGLGWLAWPGLSYMVGVVETFSWAPALSIDLGAAAVPLTWAYYGLAIAILWLAHKRWPRFVSGPDIDAMTAGQPDAAIGLTGVLRRWRWGVAFMVIPPILFLLVALAQPSVGWTPRTQLALVLPGIMIRQMAPLLPECLNTPV